MIYMGSKARLAKDTAPILNDLIEKHNITTYIEPFVGGGNMIENIKCTNKIGTDINPYLITLFNAMKDGYVPPNVTKEEYQEIKKDLEKYPPELVGVAGFLFSFRGKFFGGYCGGETKTRSNKVRYYADEAVRNVQKQMPKLKDVQFYCCGYETHSPKGCLIYCDPPYQNTTEYKGTDAFDFDRFWNWVREVSKDNIVLVSSYEAPPDFECIFSKEQTNALAANTSKKTVEKLFKYKGGRLDWNLRN